MDCRPYFVDSGAPGRGPLLGVVCADLPTNQMAIFFINIIHGDLASDDIDARAGPHRRLLIVVPRLVSASIACCRSHLPTLSVALRSDLQNRKGHEDLHVFMHDGKMRPNRSKFDRQAPTEKAVVGNFTEKQKGWARDVNSSDTCKTQHKHGTPTPASRLHGSTIRTCIHVCAWATYTRTDLLLFAY